MKLIILLTLSILSTSCNSQEKKGNSDKVVIETQIAEYITSIFKDSNGNMWFGTIDKGIARYNGKNLKYFTSKDGLPSDRVTGIIEDSKGVFWLSTGNGISKYDGKSFTNFIVSNNSNSNLVSKLLIDRKNVFWVGTWNGVFIFNGKTFEEFEVPIPVVDTNINEDLKYTVSPSEDPKGNIWFKRSGYGICKYDGNSFTYILKKDGLHSNNVTNIEFDKDENVWIGTRVTEKDDPDPKKHFGKGGVNKMVGDKIISFPEIKELNESDVYGIYRDKSENIWISTVEYGVYRYDGKSFKHFNVPISIMGMLDDQQGNLWLGGAGGLYRINQKGEVINVTTKKGWR